MRAFFCFFLALSWALYAQEKPDFDKFKANYDLIDSNIRKAQERTITVDGEWLISTQERLEEIIGVAQELRSSSQASVKEAMENIDFDPLIARFRLIHQRFQAEYAASRWSWENFYKEMNAIELVINQTKDGLKSFHQPEQISVGFFNIGVISLMVENKEFWARLCKDKGDECLVDASGKLKRQVRIFLEQMTKLDKEARTWQPPQVAPPLPDPQLAKPVIRKPG